MTRLRRETGARARLIANEESPPGRRTGILAQPNDAAVENQLRPNDLLRIVEAEIVPRLVLAERCSPCAPRPEVCSAEGVAPEAITELASLVLGPDSDRPHAYIESLRSGGASIESLYLDLMAPAARHLGDLWTADICDFTEVTVGLFRLQNLLRSFGPSFHGEHRLRARGRRILLVPFPGEQHTFGLFMVSEFFRRAGWDVWCEPVGTRRELSALVRREWFAMVGLSLGTETRLDELAGAIRTLRQVSRNRSVGMMVGGPMFVAHPDYASRIGADATAIDGREATVQAEKTLDLMGARP